ncbi:MAG: hypothetical protein GTO40_26835, partial [Deltaproteobacteria bacterium]|nr:hypothetical protein [Deltaproteobacteria bacterium]
MATPLTELAYRKAGVLTAENISNGNTFVSSLIGIDIISTEPIDPSDPAEAAAASQAQKDYSLILGAISQLSQITGKSIAELIDDLEIDIADGQLDSMLTELLSGLDIFLTNENNNTGIYDLADTGLDESLANNGISFSGEWYETGGDYGEFSISLTQTDTTFLGTYFRVRQNDGQTSTYSISGDRTANSYVGVDSWGHDYLFEIGQHPVSNSDEILLG